MTVKGAYIVIISASSTLVLALAAPLLFAQKDNAAHAKEKKDNSVYAALTRAPRKAIARHNPLAERSRRRPSLGQTSSINTA